MIVVGDAAGGIHDGAVAIATWGGTSVQVTDQEAAVALLREAAAPGDVVLVKGSRYRTWDVADARRSGAAAGTRWARRCRREGGHRRGRVAFIISLLGTPIAIRVFTPLKAGQPIRSIGRRRTWPRRARPRWVACVFIVATVIAYVAGTSS